MATINFFIQTQNNPAGIYVRLREGRNVDAKAKTKYAINPNDWSNNKGQPKNLKDENFKKLNEDLSSLKNDLLNHYNKNVNTCTINTQWLKDFISPPKKDDEITTKLLEYFEFYAKHKKNALASSSYTKLNVNKHLIERFQKYSKTEFYIKDVNADFKFKFEEYCRNQKYSQNTIARAFKNIKTICYDARNNGIETHYQLDRINIKTETVEKVFLTFKELDKIQQTDMEFDYLDNARDWLIISCETGQRVSDFLNFKKEKIRFEETIKNKKKVKVPLIEFTQQKTSKIVAVPLNKKVLAILAKRNGEFPHKISSQKYNYYIKIVCEKAGISMITSGGKIDKKINRKEKGSFSKYELVASHIGRRSFATNYYGIIPTSLLMSATGHSTEKSFLIYIGKTETEKAKQLAEYFA